MAFLNATGPVYQIYSIFNITFRQKADFYRGLYCKCSNNIGEASIQKHLISILLRIKKFHILFSKKNLQT